ncbi:MAG: glycoside hydrolase family 127 protein [Sedimentisphaerales bacterium]|nr:glycoside hydrolase family 127 protein [Sedimentisphaerales bacterium]
MKSIVNIVFVLSMAAAVMAGGVDPVDFTKVDVKDAFWGPRLQTNQKVTIPDTFKKCEDNDRMTNFLKAAGKMEGNFTGRFSFNDTDPYKILEGVGYSLQVRPDKELEKYADNLIDMFADAQWDDGYLFTYYSAGGKQPENRWKNIQWSHELYNAGHFFEAAVAYYQATGKRKILDIAIRWADCIDSEFGPGKNLDVPGHEEVEIGLVKLYRLTKEEKYLKLAKFFIDQRGRPQGRARLFGEYAQDHKPVIEQDEAVGHAVRAAYLYTAMADVAAITGDKGYIKALDKLWENVVSKKMYITGGIGATGQGEAFGANYDLPNDTAYAETCAAIANAMWNYRMFLIYGDAKYMDVLETVIYNGFLSGVSIEGNEYFYVNPLASRGNYGRSAWFECSCCPTNVARFMPSIPGYMYGVKDDTLYVNLFIGSRAGIKVGDSDVSVVQKTNYPWDGKVDIEINPEQEKQFRLAIRIPGWAQNQPTPSDLYRYVSESKEKVELKVDGERVDIKTEKGYVLIDRQWKPKTRIELDLPIPIRRVTAHPNVEADAGKVALQRGPVVYCLEGIDNDNVRSYEHLVLKDDTDLQTEFRKDLLGGVQVITGELASYKQLDDGTVKAEQVDFTAIPYYAWAHRGKGSMAVWLGRTKYEPLANPTIASLSNVSTSYQSPNANAVLSAIQDRRLPKDSGDHSKGFFHFWPHKGTSEWVEYEFNKPYEVSSCSVYWFDDTGRGECRIPVSWQILYDDNGTFKPVKNKTEYKVTKDAMDTIEFEPVTTGRLRLQLQCRERFSAGIQEWIVK